MNEWRLPLGSVVYLEGYGTSEFIVVTPRSEAGIYGVCTHTGDCLFSSVHQAGIRQVVRALAPPYHPLLQERIDTFSRGWR